MKLFVKRRNNRKDKGEKRERIEIVLFSLKVYIT
jgi:hypothetical protein